MSDDGTGTVEPPEGHLVFVPKGHAAYIYPVPAIANSSEDDGAQIIDTAAIRLLESHLPIRGRNISDYLDNDEQEPEDG